MSVDPPPGPSEAADIEAVVEASKRLLPDEDRPVPRGQHPKMHGCVRAKFVVESRLGDEFRVGIFAEPGRQYDAWIRFSNGSQADDRKPDAHGMAIKLVGVADPEATVDRPGATTQDFVLVDHPRFFIRNPSEYAVFSRAMARAAGKAGSAPLARRLLGFLPPKPRMLATLILTYFFPWRLGMLARLFEFAGQRPDSPLTSRFWSATPYRFGPGRAVKYSVRPEGTPSAGPSTASRTRDFLRAAMVAQLGSGDAVFDFRVQFFRDERTTPIEDPTVEWTERDAPPVTLARIIIPTQKFDDFAQRAFGDDLSFTPWHAIRAHEPLGGINRTRRVVYQELSALRHRANGVAMDEPGPDTTPDNARPPASCPTTFGQVLQEELELVHRRRQVLFDPDDPAPEFQPMPDEDGRLAMVRAQSLRGRTMGLSFSGGGIRSGTFAVGFLQGLAAVGILKRFDYLSTVSGGGYAGGWLAAWVRRAGSIRSVERQLNASRLAEGGADRLYIDRQVVEEEPEPLRHLRSYSSYLFPQPGLIRPDTWTVILIWARNVLINLAMLVPRALGYVALARLVVYLFDETNRSWIAAGPSGWVGGTVVGLFAGVTGGALLVAVARTFREVEEFRIGPKHRPDQARASRILGPIALASVLLTLLLRWVLWQLGSTLDRVSATPPEAVSANPLVRSAWDYLGTHLDLLDPPNVLGHVAALTVPMGVLAFVAARRRPLEPGRPRSIFPVVRAATISAAVVAVLLVLLEVLIRALNAIDRPDLMAALAPALAMLIFVAGMIVQVALLGRAIGEGEREWWARMSALLSIRAATWSGGLAIIYYVPGLIYASGGAARAAIASGWLGTATLAVLTGRYVLPRIRNRVGGLSLTWLASAASVIFLAGFMGLVGLIAALLINVPSLVGPRPPDLSSFAFYLEGVRRTGLPATLLLGLGALALSGIAIRVIDVNLFSLHAMYANRLTRCYLGASRPLRGWIARWVAPRDTRSTVGAPSLGPDREGLARTDPRDPNPITGFDPADDLPLVDLRFGLDAPPGPRDEGRYEGPLLLVNATLNLVETHNLAWRDRKGESFTLSPLFCGSKGVGYARLDPEASRENLTLGRAMAISGAAVDPNMSAYQSPPLTALLTIFNARLGYWVARPRPGGWDAASPRFGDLLITEFLGRTDGNRDFVHLSDGGHFENLGVYELVRRRCRYIVAVDAGSDLSPADDNLANLVRLCRIDFGVSIQLDTAPIRVEGPDGLARSHVVVGQVRYDELDRGSPPGVLVYVKISLTGDEPSDVLQYAEVNPPFPHQATDLRQVFDEAQFESYRCLGDHIARKVFESLPTTLLRSEEMSYEDYTHQVFERLRDRWSPATWTATRLQEHFVAEWARIQRELGDDARLAELERDLFPEVPRPQDPAETQRHRAELHLVVRMFSMMQEIWRELGLDRDATQAVHRGWMNSFRRWSGTEAARRFWPTLAPSYAPEFVRFCRERMYLDGDRPRLVPLPAAGTSDPFAGEALDLILREFDREWPEPGGGELLRRLIAGADELGLTDRPCWVLVQGGPDAPGAVPCGIVLAGADGSAGPDGVARPRFFAWLRRSFRSAGPQQDALRGAVDGIAEALRKAGRATTLWASYPSVDPDDARRSDWVRFHEHLDFQFDPQPGPGEVTVLRRDDYSRPSAGPVAEWAGAGTANHDGSWE